MTTKYFYTVSEILGEVTNKNYFVNTIAEFDMVAEWDEANRIWNKMKRESGFEYHHSPIEGSCSEYLIDNKEGVVYRFSNHWGKCASCNWKIKNCPSKVVEAVAKCSLKEFKFYGNVFYTDVEKLLSKVS